MSDQILSNLNSAQYEAVTAPLSGQYQILAGPGTGKTKTLTSRIAFLMKSIPAKNIIVMTFTNAAAREMQDRIKQMLPNNHEISKLNIGTFHGECFKYLVRFGSKIGLSNKITIADPTDQSTIMKEIVHSAHFKVKLEEFGYTQKGKIYYNHSSKQSINIDPKHCIRKISEFKSHGYTNPDDFVKVSQNEFNSPIGKFIYQQYQDELDNNGLVDFDDIIIKCRDLLRKHPQIVSNIQAVLVDEFQDSNKVQLELTQLFANATGNITIVGDPDQSIYAFRNAQPENIRILSEIFPCSKIIYLEENYRSIQPILNTATGIIQKDVDRIGSDRRLKSQDIHSSSTTKLLPYLLKFRNEHQEAKFIIDQIQYLKASSGALLSYKDIAILSRTSYASKKCELELAFNGIPYKVLGGFKFWDRVEVRAVVDYLRVVNSDNDKVAITRTINMPKRGFGDVSSSKLLARIDDEQTIFSQLKRFANDSTFRSDQELKLRGDALKGLQSYVGLIEECRELLQQEAKPADCVSKILDNILEKTDLIKSFGDNNEEKRNENINLIRSHIQLVFDEENEDIQPDPSEVLNPLQRLLLSLSLGGDADDNISKNSNDRVTISTMHSSKGLEWPVVFSINTIDDHVARSGDEMEAEERRLLFVSVTRAKILLYMTYPTEVSKFGSNEETVVSRLLDGLDKYYKRSNRDTTNLSIENFNDFARFLKRPVPDFKKFPANLQSSSKNGKKHGKTEPSYSGFTYASNLSQNQTHRTTKKQKKTSEKHRTAEIPPIDQFNILPPTIRSNSGLHGKQSIPSLSSILDGNSSRSQSPAENTVPQTSPLVHLHVNAPSHINPPTRKTLGVRRRPTQQLPF